jgi:hypothetical protein
VFLATATWAGRVARDLGGQSNNVVGLDGFSDPSMVLFDDGSPRFIHEVILLWCPARDPPFKFLFKEPDRGYVLILT